MNSKAATEGAVRKKANQFTFIPLNQSGTFLAGDADQADHAPGFALIASVGKEQIVVADCAEGRSLDI